MPDKRDSIQTATASAAYAGESALPTRSEIERLTRLLEEFDRRSSTSTTVPPEVEAAVAAVSAALKSLESALALQESPVRVTAIEPSSGPDTGLQDVTIVGTSILPGTTVSFGSNPASEVQIVGQTLIKAKTPPGVEGKVDVIVNTLAGGATLSGAYTYLKTAPAPR